MKTMSDPTTSRRLRARWWAIIFACWTLVGLFFTSQIVIQSAFLGSAIPFWRAASWQLFSTYLWVLLTPLVLWLGRRFPIERRRLLPGLAVHIVASVVVAMLHQSVDALVLPALGYPPGKTFTSYADAYRTFLAFNSHLAVLTYWGTLGIGYIVDYYRKYRERELRASQLETVLAQARLQVLKMQLHPHFLFNTLNTISELIYKDADAAERMIANLSDLLRISLDKLGVQEVPLKQELEFLRKYLEIEETRYQQRLQVSLAIDPQTLDARVPNMILQPLVENAILHGVAPRVEGGRIEIAATRENGTLRLRVADNGAGLRPERRAPSREGVGLANTRARLDHLYGPDHRFRLSAARGGGVTVDLSIPYRESDAAQGERIDSPFEGNRPTA